MNHQSHLSFIRVGFISLVLDCVFSQCHNHCSYNGICSPDGRCDCITGFKGADCSERLCPIGSAFNDIAYSMDLAHQDVECSNRGFCDRTSGNCKCMDGFTGTACERTLCPNDCRGNGICTSYHDFASNNYNSNSEKFNYNSVWDAHKIYGCVCDFGYIGYDCSLRQCASGDDPLTAGGVQEMQLMKCSASYGTFVLYFEGRHSKTISATADTHDVELALNSIKGVDDVTITFSEGAMVCRYDVTNIVQISFNGNFGPLPPLVPIDINLNSGASVTIGADPVTGQMLDDASVAYVPVKGTKENIECSNRGSCDYATATCQCFDFLFIGSDGHGETGDHGDCGHALDIANITSCPKDCSYRGWCDMITKTCSCEKGYTGFDCTQRVCPKGNSWFSYPSSDNTGHDEMIECSNMGTCERNGGYCLCHEGYFGSACEYSK